MHYSTIGVTSPILVEFFDLHGAKMQFIPYLGTRHVIGHLRPKKNDRNDFSYCLLAHFDRGQTSSDELATKQIDYRSYGNLINFIQIHLPGSIILLKS